MIHGDACLGKGDMLEVVRVRDGGSSQGTLQREVGQGRFGGGLPGRQGGGNSTVSIRSPMQPGRTETLLQNLPTSFLSASV